MNEGKADNKPYDTAFKDLAEQDPEALLRLIGALPAGATIKPLPREVTAPALFTDQPYEVTSAAEHFVAHLEAQTYYEDDIPSRIVKYDAILWLNTGLPVRSYVLILSQRGMTAAARTEITVDADGLTLTARFQLIKLWELDVHRALAMKRESLLPFIPLMNGGTEEMAQGARAVGEVANEARRRELALHFVVLGGLRYARNDVLDYLERYGMMPIQQLKDSSVYQFILAEGREEGLRQGLEQGLEQGRKVVEKVLLAHIEKQFPGLELKAELDQISDLQQLERLYFNLDQIANAEELRAKVTELATKN